MILIGENINIMSEALGSALRDQETGPLEDMARAEVDAGMDVLDLNIGPARRNGEAFMTWVVTTVRNATDKMLSLDTTNLDAMEAGLKAGKGSFLINSVSLQSSRIDRGLEMAARYSADLIGLLWSNEGMPRDVNERAMHAVDLVYRANDAGIPNEKIWIDPIVSPVSVEINQVKSCIEFMAMLGEIAPGCKSTVGLSNVSNGTPPELRGWLNRTYLIMLERYGLYSAIVDAFDNDLIDLARGRRPDIVDVIHRAMDGESVDMASLSPELASYAKTVKVLNGESLYSHAWLEI